MPLSSKEQLRDVVFCSLGENCLGQGVLDRKGLNCIVTPFSWGRVNIDYVFEVVREDFADLLNPALLEYRMVFQKPIAKNLKYQCAEGVFIKPMSSGFEFTHHDVIEYEEARVSMKRKIQRFRDVVMNSDTGVVLMYHHRPPKHSSLEYVEKQLSSLLQLAIERRGANNISALLFYQIMISQHEERRVVVSRQGGVLRAEFFTRQMWNGTDTDIFWARVDDDLLDLMFSQVTNLILGASTSQEFVGL